MPCRISGKRDVTLSFRPSRPMKNVTFRAVQGERTVAELKVRKAVPAVMLHLPLKKEDLSSDENVKVVAVYEQ